MSSGLRQLKGDTVKRRLSVDWYDDVNDAVVTARPNPLMGNVLVATVELRPGVAADGMPKQLRSWVRDRAPRTHVPATVDIVERLEIASTGKVIR